LFGSGLHDENGDWIYSQQSAYDQFIETCPEEQIECRVSSQHRGRIINLELLNIDNVGKRKSNCFTIPDVENVNRIVQQNPYVYRLSQQIGNSNTKLPKP
jgi:hypothetical protein